MNFEITDLNIWLKNSVWKSLSLKDKTLNLISNFPIFFSKNVVAANCEMGRSLFGRPRPVKMSENLVDRKGREGGNAIHRWKIHHQPWPSGFCHGRLPIRLFLLLKRGPHRIRRRAGSWWDFFISFSDEFHGHFSLVRLWAQVTWPSPTGGTWCILFQECRGNVSSGKPRPVALTLMTTPIRVTSSWLMIRLATWRGRPLRIVDHC